MSGILGRLFAIRRHDYGRDSHLRGRLRHADADAVQPLLSAAAIHGKPVCG
jgi:hypothetical protein